MYVESAEKPFSTENFSRVLVFKSGFQCQKGWQECYGPSLSMWFRSPACLCGLRMDETTHVHDNNRLSTVCSLLVLAETIISVTATSPARSPRRRLAVTYEVLRSRPSSCAAAGPPGCHGMGIVPGGHGTVSKRKGVGSASHISTV